MCINYKYLSCAIFLTVSHDEVFFLGDQMRKSEVGYVAWGGLIMQGFGSGMWKKEITCEAYMTQ
jgi:hypothetical protein